MLTNHVSDMDIQLRLHNSQSLKPCELQKLMPNHQFSFCWIYLLLLTLLTIRSSWPPSHHWASQGFHFAGLNPISMVGLSNWPREGRYHAVDTLRSWTQRRRSARLIRLLFASQLRRSSGTVRCRHLVICTLSKRASIVANAMPLLQFVMPRSLDQIVPTVRTSVSPLCAHWLLSFQKATAPLAPFRFLPPRVKTDMTPSAPLFFPHRGCHVGSDPTCLTLDLQRDFSRPFFPTWPASLCQHERSGLIQGKWRRAGHPGPFQRSLDAPTLQLDSWLWRSTRWRSSRFIRPNFSLRWMSLSLILWLRELRSATDLALRTTCGHLWLTLMEIKVADKVSFLDAPISPSGLFGPTVEGFAERFTEAQKLSQAMWQIAPDPQLLLVTLRLRRLGSQRSPHLPLPPLSLPRLVQPDGWPLSKAPAPPT